MMTGMEMDHVLMTLAPRLGRRARVRAYRSYQEQHYCQLHSGLSDGEASRGPARTRGSRRDDPRRHTLAGNHLYVHPHHPPQLNSHEMELSTTGPPRTESHLAALISLAVEDECRT
ncbi:hypothetical protein MSG28_000809 [Choristoneura fumiferana]|uniref:Uncharacterized protein n=1 Tax=Choristoneura fumiferana TaxID=7141 RepID=A0ACC0K2V3_CHOFU|nr:hypothetical protein MSG28_000809 [Choristoneura fumiferana]